MRWPSLLALCGASFLLAPRLPAQAPTREQFEQAAAARVILARLDSPPKSLTQRYLHVIYFTPQDTPPAEGWQERIPRVMEHVRQFYARQMGSYGFGPRTFALNYDKDRRLVIHLVRGSKPRPHYTFPPQDDGSHQTLYQRICAETQTVLAAKGIKLQQEHCLIFCNVLEVDNNKGSGYMGGYTNYGHGWGTAWVGDHRYVDVPALTDKTSVLDFGTYKNTFAVESSFRIGTVGHEAGHAFGLRHNRENAADRARGQSLMGLGNFRYGAELRGEGPGAFLPLADVLRLAAHPVFSNTQAQFTTEVQAHLRGLSVATSAREFRLNGQIVASMPCYAVLAYLDPDGGDDYDAHTSVAIPDAQGRFALTCRDLVANKSAELRLVACFINGSSWTQAFQYSVSQDGQPEVRGIRQPRLASLQSYNAKHSYIQHRDWLGGITELNNDLDRQLTSFQLVPGLADSQQVSLRPWNHGREYLRPQQGRVKLQRCDATELFRKEATFRVVPGLADKTWISLEAAAAPGHFLRHKNAELWVEKNDSSELFARDATFRIVPPTEKRLQDAYAEQINVTGSWAGDDQGAYSLRQVGDQLSWLGESADGGKSWSHVFRGTIRDAEIAGQWVDLPRGAAMGAGTLKLQVQYREDVPVEIRVTEQQGPGFGLKVLKRLP